MEVRLLGIGRVLQRYADLSLRDVPFTTTFMRSNGRLVERGARRVELNRTISVRHRRCVISRIHRQACKKVERYDIVGIDSNRVVKGLDRSGYIAELKPLQRDVAPPNGLPRLPHARVGISALRGGWAACGR